MKRRGATAPQAPPAKHSKASASGHDTQEAREPGVWQHPPPPILSTVFERLLAMEEGNRWVSTRLGCPQQRSVKAPGLWPPRADAHHRALVAPAPPPPT